MIREPFEPESVKDWGLIIHADSAGTRVDVYWVDINAGRIGLALANEVRQWRRRDDLLTMGRQIRITPTFTADDVVGVDRTRWDDIEPGTYSEPAPESDRPPLAALAPAEASRVQSRREYLTGRVRAVLAHSDVAAKALQIEWPQGIPGLKHEGHTWEQLEAITAAVERVEANHTIPFYGEWNDPSDSGEYEIPFSDRWAKPSEAKPTDEDRESIQTALANHPRSGLMRRWISYAITGGIDHTQDSTALAHALFEFGKVPESEWSDDDITTMLHGSLRAIGYDDGVYSLGRFNPEHAPLLMSAAFAIVAGNAYLLFDENNEPIVRTNVRGTS
jgi:hypothetical protein